MREKDEKKKKKEHPFRAFSPTTEPDPRLVIVIILQIHSVIRFARLSHNTVVNKYRIFSKPKFISFCSQQLYLLYRNVKLRAL